MLDPGDRVAGGRLDATSPTLVRLTVGAARAHDGVALKACVVTVHRIGCPPTGTVAFRTGHRLLGTAPLDEAGTATLDGVRLPAGLHPVVASYGGDGAHAPATSPPAPHVVAAALSVVVALAVPERRGSKIVLRAQVLDAATGRVEEDAEGQVAFALDGALLGSAPLAAGEASLVLHDLAVGRITARLVGDLDPGT